MPHKYPNRKNPPPAPKGHKRSVGNKGGAPAIYRAVFSEVVELAVSRGATVREVAEKLKIHRDTIDGWRRKHPKFDLAFVRGREGMIDNVEASLYDRATGYKHSDLDIRTVAVGNGCSQIVKTPITKHYPPDTGAATFILKNLRNQQWKDRQELTGEDGGPVMVVVQSQLNPDEVTGGAPKE